MLSVYSHSETRHGSLLDLSHLCSDIRLSSPQWWRALSFNLQCESSGWCWMWWKNVTVLILTVEKHLLLLDACADTQITNTLNNFEYVHIYNIQRDIKSFYNLDVCTVKVILWNLKWLAGSNKLVGCCNIFNSVLIVNLITIPIKYCNRHHSRVLYFLLQEILDCKFITINNYTQ